MVTTYMRSFVKEWGVVCNFFQRFASKEVVNRLSRFWDAGIKIDESRLDNAILIVGGVLLLTGLVGF